MSYTYSPDADSSPLPPLNTSLFSQRDLGLQVPINFVTAPGVSLTSACFAHQIYEDGAATLCLSNLLAVDFRRFEIDLYWDQGRSLWSLCPVSFPISNSSSSSSSRSRTGSSPAVPSVLTSDASPTLKISARQAVITSSIVTVNTTMNDTIGTPTSLGSVLPTFTSPPNFVNETLVSLGPYKCTSTISFQGVLSLLLDYIQKTETTLAAHLIYVAVNLHAAASSTSPTGPAPSQTRLPDSNSLLGNLLPTNLSTFVYTPDNLWSDRGNLNQSWYTVSERYRPTSDYYAVAISPNDIFSTDSGWPSESYVEFSLSKRLLLQWGNIDPQMANYNFTADTGVFFPKDYIQKNQSGIIINQAGNITTGCYLVNSTENVSVSNINSSWATAATISGFNYASASSADISSALVLSSNLVDCGVSTILNVTLLGSTADTDFIPYSNFSYSTIWSWATNEPKNYSSSTQDALFRCATSQLELGGHWAVGDCSQKYYAACRATGQPFNFTLSGHQVSYSSASQACSEPYVFAVPRTALENSFLTQAIRNSHIDLSGQGVWVDFNSLDIRGCWVTGGQRATCPYTSGSDPLGRRTVLVPTVAAIIVLVITALTVFIKLAGHRRVRKRTRRRINNGIVYEGVPS